MDVVLHRPRSVRIGLARSDAARRTTRPGARSMVDLLARAFLTGQAIGMLVLTERQAVVSVTVIGIVALGVALLSWDR